MADVKISALPPASTPLSGAELVPVVQGGQTVQTTVNAVTSQTTFLQAGAGAVLRSGQDKMRDIINAKDFGVVGDGIADDTAALQRAINAAAGRTLVLTGTFRVTAPASPTAAALVISAPDTYIVGQGVARIVASGSWATGQVVLEARGAGPLASTTLTAAITSTSTTFSVANAANLTPGTFVQISSSGEYWSGIAGDPGFQIVYKKELNCIRSASGTVITPEWGFADTYSITGNTVTVTPYQFINGIKIEGVQFYGPGNGNANTLNNSPVAVRSIYVDDFSFTNCRIENFQNTAIEVEFTNDSRITNNEIIGRDLADPTNLPTISAWFYGAVFNGSTNWIFSNNNCQYLRRAVDANGTSGYPISRNGVVTGNTAISCMNGYGAHFCQNIIFSSNLAVKCQSGLYFRGKDVYIANNSFESISPTTSGAGILIGGDDGTNYPENPSSGRVIIANNHIKTAVQGIYLRIDVDSASITNNVIYGGNSNGITFEGKRTQDVIISGNFIDLTNRTADRRCINIPNTYGRFLVVKNITIVNNRLKNATDAIRIEGPSAIANAASNIVIKGNTIDRGAGAGTNRAIRITNGAFAKNLVFRDNLYGDPTAITGIAPGVTLDLTAPNSFEIAPDVGDNAFWDYNQQTIAFASSTALQTKLVTAVGQKITNSSPAPGGYMGWVCTSAGVVGSLTAVNGGVAITGNINSGTDQLTVSSNNNAAIFVGAYITIAGAGVAGAPLATRVTAVNSLVITVANNASTTVAGAAVTYTNPVFKGFGLIET